MGKLDVGCEMMRLLVVSLFGGTLGLAVACAYGESYVRVNQLGYRPGDVKVAMGLGRDGLPAVFQVIDAATGRVEFAGKSRQIDETWGQLSRHAELDFSALDKEGEYFIRCGDSESPRFHLSTAAYAELPDQLLGARLAIHVGDQIGELLTGLQQLLQRFPRSGASSSWTAPTVEGATSSG
jgi:hypothetical protein